MKNAIKKITRSKRISPKKIVLGIFVGLAVLLLAGFCLSYSPASEFKTGFLKIFPFPLALVNGQPVSVKDFLARLDLVTKINSVENKTAISRQQVFEKLVYDTQTAQLARSRRVLVTDSEIDEAFTKVANTQLETGQPMSELLPKLGISENEYKQLLIRPELLSEKLKFWFNSQKDLNPNVYGKADEAFSLISSGQDFETVAAKYSQDSFSAQIGGNFGFLTISDILPEMRERIDIANPGELLMLPSRSGLQILKILAKDNNGPNGETRVELQGIVIHSEGFEEWRTTEAKNLSVRILIKNY